MGRELVRKPFLIALAATSSAVALAQTELSPVPRITTVQIPPCVQDLSTLGVLRVYAQWPGDAAPQARGTAVVVADGYMVTAGHVVSAEAAMTVAAGGALRPAQLVSWAPMLDLALIRVDTTGYPPLPITASWEVNQPVWTMGFPGVTPGHGASIPGAVFYLDASGTELVVSAAVWPGMSGGALVSCNSGKTELSGVIVSHEMMLISSETSGDGLSTTNTYLNSGVSRSKAGALVRQFVTETLASEAAR